MGRSLFVALLVCASVPIAAAGNTDPAGQPDVAGRYVCEGISPAGSPYHGIADIVRLDDTFRIVWTLAGDSGEVQQVMGVGILSNGIFAASYFGGGPGVAVYRIDGSKLIGEWTMGGADGTTYPETLTRLTKEQERDLEQLLDQDHDVPQRRPARFREALLAP